MKKRTISNEETHQKFISEMVKMLDKKGWTRKKLADEMGITASRLSDYLNGKRSPTYETLEMISAALNIPVENFLAADTENNKNTLDEIDNEIDFSTSKIPFYGSIENGPGIFKKNVPDSYITCPVKRYHKKNGEKLFANSAENMILIFKNSVIAGVGKTAMLSIPSMKKCVCGVVVSKSSGDIMLRNVESHETDQFKMSQYRVIGTAVQSIRFYDE